MKRIYRILIYILLVVAIFALVSCDKKPQPKQLAELTLPELNEKEMAVIIKNGDSDYTSYTVRLGKGGVEATTVEDVLEYLHKECNLTLTWQDSQYGKFLTAIGGISAEGSAYIEVFTSNVDFQGTWAGVDVIEADGVTLVAASVGVTELGVKAGDIVYFELGVYIYY